VLESADAQFGAGSGPMTNCVAVRDGVKVVVALNSDVLNGKGISQQVNNVANMVGDYTGSYAMVANQNFKIVAIGYGAGARWLLNDTAYMNKYGTTNPSAATVATLIGQGVKFYMCQNTMRGNNWKKDDLLPNVDMVTSGVTAVIDFQKRRYTYIAP
jgi:intracellular sulfur oxidation DsrE/DsrF family protein